MKKITSLFLICLMAIVSFAQQLPMYSQYYQSPFLYNPAATGILNTTSIYLINHTQWVGMPGGPITRAVAADGSLIKDKAGVGLLLYKDATDITSRLGAMGTYAYRIKTGENSKVSLGLGLGIVDNRIDYSKIIVKDANDLALFNNIQNKTTFDGNAGVLFSWKTLDIGVAVPHLFASKINYNTHYIHSSYSLARHYLATVKYDFTLSKNLNLRCIPLVMARYMPEAPLQYDVNLIFDWNDIVGIGAAYKSNYAITPSAYFKVHKSLTVGYAYDYITSKISSYAGTSHELFLSYRFAENKKQGTEEMQKDINDLKKKLESDSIELKKTNIKVDSLGQELRKVKTDVDSSKQKSQELEKQIQNYIESKNKTTQEGTINNNNNGNVGNTANSDNATNIPEPQKSDIQNIQKIGTADADGVRSVKIADFNTPDGKKPKPGYYLVVGTFFYNDYALAEIERFKKRGFKNTTYVFYNPLKYHYLFTGLLQSKEEAVKMINSLKANVQSDAWILHLEE
jgi:type IX secretion system PorP/SprF family membrane protein